VILAAKKMAILVTCLFAFPGRAQAQNEDVIRINSDLVNVFFSAVDRNNNFSTAIAESDIALYEDDVRQEFFTFQKQPDRPLSIALLIDLSTSQKEKLSEEKKAALSFVNSVVSNKHDRVAVISFGADPFLEQSLTSNINEVAESLERMKILSPVGYEGRGRILPVGARAATGSLTYTTAIWDAIWITSKSVMSEVEPQARRVIVIITDGEDTSSRATLDEAIDGAIQADTIVFAIGIGDPKVSNGVNKSALKKLGSETGGQVYFPRTDDDLNNSFKRIERELRSQYVVAYVPHQTKPSGPYRRIRIEVTSPALKRNKLRLFYRKDYYVKPSFIKE